MTKAQVIDFYEWKTRPYERVESKPITVKEGPPTAAVKKKPDLYERRTKATAFLGHINSQYWHMFSYPILACRMPKSYHSFEVLACHIFSQWGTILRDDSFPVSQPGIWFAKKEAYARREDITSFLSWRLRKYLECASYYGDDINIVKDHIDCINIWYKRFDSFFFHYATESAIYTV